MPTHLAAPRAAAPPITGLVSVDGKTFPLRAAGIAGRAEGGVAATTLTQTYANPYAEPLETLYTLPLPADGVVVGYTIRMGERVLRGEVRRREEAAEAYRQALYEGHTAGLLEAERADTFTQRLGSVPPGATVEVAIEVLQPLGFVAGLDEAGPRWEYRFPTVAGVRYEGAPGRVPDAGKLDAGRADADGTPVRISCDLTIADGPAGRVAPVSPSHDVIVEDASASAARVRLAAGARLDRDLVVRWAAASAEAGASLAEGPGLEGDDGRYGLLTITPPAAVGASFPRDVTLLIDASGSMSGEPIRRAKQVAERVLRSLDDQDRFEILVFSNVTRRLQRRPVAATEAAVDKAVAALRVLEAGGGTEMTSAMIEALRPLREDSQRQVILITDGYIGFEAEVIGEVRRRLAPGARLHAVAIGSAPNRSLTNGVARAGRGIEVFVGDDGAFDEAAGRLHRATVRPVLTEVQVSGSAVKASAPERPRDVFEGQPLVLAVELAPGGGAIEVRARHAGDEGPWVRTIDVPARLSPGEAPAKPGADGNAGDGVPLRIPVGALHGREMIADLDLRLAAGEGADVIDAEVERLGLRHRIASRRTSLVAISDEPDVDPRAPRRRERLPVELPAELSAEGVGLTPGLGVMMQASFAATRTMGAGPGLFTELARARSLSPPSSRRGLFHRLLGLGDELPSEEPVTDLHLEMARILKRDGDLLVIELRVRTDGLTFPAGDGKIAVLVEDVLRTAVVVPELSSLPGPHARDTLIRIALRLEGGDVWTGGPIVVVGTGELDGKKVLLRITLTTGDPGEERAG